MPNKHDVTYATLNSMEQLLKVGWNIIFHEVVRRSQRGVLCQCDWEPSALSVLRRVGLIKHGDTRVTNKMVETSINSSCASDSITLTINCAEMPRFRGIKKVVGLSP